MKSVLVLLAVCTITAAMVPRQRNTSATTTTNQPVAVCAPQTPCAWSTYKSGSKVIEYSVTNTYCNCNPDMECQINEDDTTVNAYIHRCRLPAEPEASTEVAES